MTCVDVTTQQQLDDALGRGDHPHIHSGDDVPLIVRHSSSVEAWDSSRVVAWDSSRVVARGSSSVVAWDSSSVEGTRFVAIQRHGDRVTVVEGSRATVIDIPACDRLDDWIDYHGVELDDDGRLVLFKALGDDLTSDHRLPDGTGCRYVPGETVEAPDWNPHDGCGQGLHLSPTVDHTLAYRPDATRWVAVAAAPDDLVVVAGYGRTPDKVKARRCEVLHELDRRGRRVEGVPA